MTVNEFARCLDLVEGLPRNTDAQNEVVMRLTHTLLQSPDDFAEQWFDAHADPEALANGASLMAELGRNGKHGDLRFLVELEDRRIRSVAASIAAEQDEGSK